ncbi:thioredoxin [Synechococcus sp. PCC 7336]|uniref:thioredoxin n=1 Tax=Synechococcus sp. PCC 7336 TaxID=195250 RepID=UPI0003496644|nr:thioredoxin [Synechococcus sp. PCC 7336]
MFAPITSTPIELTDNTFATEVLDNALPVLVEFWAPWCASCRAISPVIDELAMKFDGRLKVAAMDIEEYEEVATEYNISTIPTLAIFQNGREVERIQGLQSKKVITDKIVAAIDSSAPNSAA